MPNCLGPRRVAFVFREPDRFAIRRRMTTPRVLAFCSLLLFIASACAEAPATFTRTEDVIYGRKFGTALTLAVLTLMQGTLGVWTLLLAVPITLGLAHQAGAIAVFAVALYHFWLALHVPESAPAPQNVASA